MDLSSNKALDKPGKNNTAKEIAMYLGGIFLSVLTAVWALRLWKADIFIPYWYGMGTADAPWTYTMIKGIVDNGWYLTNRFVGMPSGLYMQDFPMAENLHWFVMKIISLGFPNYAFTVNVYYLLTFPLTTLATVIVFRHFKISRLAALAGGLLYAVLPYHFTRGQQHLTNAAYYLIPLIVMVILWVYMESSRGFNFSKWIIATAVCFLISSSVIYYSFFSCYLLLIAGIAAALQHKQMRPLLIACLLTGVICCGVFLNLRPSMVYERQQGINPEVAWRVPWQSELLGLRVLELILPNPGHRISSWAHFTKTCETRSALREPRGAQFSSLGIVTTLGFLILTGWLLYGKRENSFLERTKKFMTLMSGLSILNIFSLLLGLVGGWGLVFACLVSPKIREYRRLSVFVAFFSLLALFLILQFLYEKYAKTRMLKILSGIGLMGLLILGLFDQCSPNFVPPYEKIKEKYNSDAGFIRAIESSVPANAMIFQLPYIPFPEALINSPDVMYQHFTAYLQSRTLRWSFGAMRGREADRWQKKVSSLPPKEFVEAISAVGFKGIYIDRVAYEKISSVSNAGEEIITRLSVLLGTKPLISADRRFVFFKIPEGFH